MPILHGREPLLAAIEARLAAGGGVALHGPPGIGRSALLDAVADTATARGDLVLRLRPARGERGLAYAGVADLLRQIPAGAVAALAPAPRHLLAAFARGRPPRAGVPALARRLVLPELLAHCARQAPVLLVLDDVQWLDPESAELIGFAMRGGRAPGSAWSPPSAAASERPGSAPRRSPCWRCRRSAPTTSPRCWRRTACPAAPPPGCTRRAAATPSWRWRSAARSPPGRRGGRRRCPRPPAPWPGNGWACSTRR